MSTRILIAENDESLRNSLRLALLQAGFDVITAADGDEAEYHFVSSKPDLLLLDLNLSRQSGWNVFEVIKALEPLVPVIVFSGLRTNDERAPLPPGVGAVFHKPLQIKRLINTMNALLAEPMEKRLQRITYHLKLSLSGSSAATSEYA